MPRTAVVQRREHTEHPQTAARQFRDLGVYRSPFVIGHTAETEDGLRGPFCRVQNAAQGVLHSITSCRAPCNRTTGIAYPLADGPVDFDSGELGYGPQGFTAAANRDTWSTPADLNPGTYTYFCRIHPFMRGSFRVGGS